MEFPLARTAFGPAWSPGSGKLFLSILSAVIGMSACNTTSTSEVTDVNVSFSRSENTAAPDTIRWEFGGQSGFVTAPQGIKDYAVPIHLEKAVGKDSIKLELRTLSVVTYRLVGIGGQEKSTVNDFEVKKPDAVANKLLTGLDVASKASSPRYTYDRKSLHTYYVDQLLSGDTLFKGYPGNAPTGIDTALVDSLILRKVVDSKDSVAKVAASWGVLWTAEQVKPVYRKWLNAGTLRLGQYDTLYPYDDRPPTLVRQLVFTGAKDSNAIQRGTSGVKVEGRFADDTGIVSQKIRIFAKNGDDATMKFTITASDFPATPQKLWDLANNLSIKTESAPTDLYTLQIDFADRKSQTITAKLAFYVYPVGGVMIDSLAPNIVPSNPASRVDTVVDTTRSYQVRFAVSDQNLKTVVFDGADTAKLIDRVATKSVALVEGRESVVRIWAVDSMGNQSRDSARIFRRVAVRPAATWNHPATGRDSVPDTTYTYSFRWKVDGQDVDSILIDGQPVLLDNQKIASRILPLTLDGRTTVRIRVVDKLRHAVEDSMVVARASSVAPLVRRVAIPDGVVTVPDTQSFYAANWSVLDNDLDTLRVQGASASLSDGKCGITVFLKAGDTTRISVWAKDKLGSVGTDTIKVWRPDPRAPYLSEIEKVQRGDSVVPLTDFVLPNIRFGRFEVTVDLYAKVMKSARITERAGLPMTNVSIYDAMLFCNAMSKAAGLDTFYVWSTRDAATGYFRDSLRSDSELVGSEFQIRKGFRLPNDSEWLSAAGGTQGGYPWGNSIEPRIVDQYAIWNTQQTSLVGSRNPTRRGLFDLAGNVSEWVYRKNGPPQKNVRWFFEGGDATSAIEGLMLPNPLEPIIGYTTSTQIGFRIVRVGSN
jgi:hypothetical protein